MEFQYNDGGRADAGYTGTTGDCACRAIAIATGKPYQEVYDLINEYGQTERRSKRKSKKSTARGGVFMATMKRIMASLGWEWKATMLVGSGCKVHLKKDELPEGRIIARVSRHYVAVVDGVVNDNHDSSRGGTRCVYGYWYKNE